MGSVHYPKIVGYFIQRYLKPNKTILHFSYICLFLGCNWLVSCKYCSYHCYRALTHTHIPGFTHHPLCLVVADMSNCGWYSGKTITSGKSFFSLALFPGFCMKELLNLLTCVSVQALDMASLPSFRHSILKSDRIIQELWTLLTR